MNLERGDVLKARFPHASGTRGKKRPVVVVQANTYNQRLRHVVVAQITANLAEQSDPSCILINANTPEAIATGIQRDSLISCALLSVMSEDRLTEKIGKLTPPLLTKLDRCLKIVLGISI